VVEKLSRMEHPNLVLFLGFCFEKNNKYLCYELMSNGNLEDRLHGKSPESTSLERNLLLSFSFSKINDQRLHQSIMCS
jgi:serine/threonine protein kinase